MRHLNNWIRALLDLNCSKHFNKSKKVNYLKMVVFKDSLSLYLTTLLCLKCWYFKSMMFGSKFVRFSDVKQDFPVNHRGLSIPCTYQKQFDWTLGIAKFCPQPLGYGLGRQCTPRSGGQCRHNWPHQISRVSCFLLTPGGATGQVTWNVGIYEIQTPERTEK